MKTGGVSVTSFKHHRYVMIPPLYRFELLAPSPASLVSEKIVEGSTHLYHKYLGSVQRLRGRAYLQDGAIKQWQLDELGRYRMNDDELCWHFILVDQQEEAIGCARYLLHPFDATYDGLWVSQSPLARNPIWGSSLRRAIEDTLQKAGTENIQFAELGGWAIASEYRNTRAALEILLASYLWGEMIGHCLCSCTATVRNNSASILRRIGATSLIHNGQDLPVYFDEQYGCRMEILSFDSRQLPARFGPLLNEMRSKLPRNSIIRCTTAEEIGFSLDLVNLQKSVATKSAKVIPFTPDHGTPLEAVTDMLPT